jgi:L-rhamnose mutarotase
MVRAAWRLKVRREKMDEYVARHADVWPEMLDALRSSGWKNYSIFLDRNDCTLFGYFETEDLQASQAAMSKMAINAKWQEDMAPFFEDLGGAHADRASTTLEQVFFLQ